MSDSKDIQAKPNIQLELFQTSKKLNLSENYEAIPKEVSITDPAIVWVTEHIAKPVEKVFEWQGETYVSEISPANFEDSKSKTFKSHFPGLREARIEYALIALASKHVLELQTDSENKTIFFLRVTYYEIQKAIVEAINKRQGKELKPNSCPYNTTSIREAFEILKRTDITVKGADGVKGYIFTRIKDFYYDDKKVVIELGNMITSYISSGDWKATDSHSILASTGMYELRLRVILNMKFRYIAKGLNYRISLNKLIQDINFVEGKRKGITLQKIVALLEKMHEVEKVEVDKRMEGRTLVDAILFIHGTEEFTSMMIENNKLTARTKKPVIGEEGVVLVEPVKAQFPSNADYQKAKRQFEVQRGKSILKGRGNLFGK